MANFYNEFIDYVLLLKSELDVIAIKPLYDHKDKRYTATCYDFYYIRATTVEYGEIKAVIKSKFREICTEDYSLESLDFIDNHINTYDYLPNVVHENDDFYIMSYNTEVDSVDLTDDNTETIRTLIKSAQDELLANHISNKANHEEMYRDLFIHVTNPLIKDFITAQLKIEDVDIQKCVSFSQISKRHALFNTELTELFYCDLDSIMFTYEFAPLDIYESVCVLDLTSEQIDNVFAPYDLSKFNAETIKFLKLMYLTTKMGYTIPGAEAEWSETYNDIIVVDYMPDQIQASVRNHILKLINVIVTE